MNLTAQPAFDLIPPQAARNPMRVTKRSGMHEPIDVNKIVRAVTRCCEGILPSADAIACALENLQNCEACQ
jgi:ribonucleoside-diphosphate reductase alpha chain